MLIDIKIGIHEHRQQNFLNFYQQGPIIGISTDSQDYPCTQLFQSLIFRIYLPHL